MWLTPSSIARRRTMAASSGDVSNNCMAPYPTRATVLVPMLPAPPRRGLWLIGAPLIVRHWRMRRVLRLCQGSRNGGASALVGRSDARRNRERLLQAATAAFTAHGGSVALESIAREAGVGIGTLYRHFPNREALVEAIYRAELADVAAAAGQLLTRHPPKVALRRWRDRYASFVAAKRGMAESLRAIFDSGALVPSHTRDSI